MDKIATTEEELRKVDGPPAYLTARWVLAAFTVTFLVARVLVLLIMTHRMPNLYFYAGSDHTHVHHLNYGIFLLTIVGAYVLFRRPHGWRFTASAITYGIALGLTFDEFGMWLHLGGPYWQRASFDAVIVIAALLGLLASAPEIRHIRTKHFAFGIVLLVALATFVWLVVQMAHSPRWDIGPTLQRIEENAPQ